MGLSALSGLKASCGSGIWLTVADRDAAATVPGASKAAGGRKMASDDGVATEALRATKA